MTVWKWITSCFRSKPTTPPALPADFQWIIPVTTSVAGTTGVTLETLEMPRERFATNLPSAEDLDIVETSALIATVAPPKVKKKAKPRKRK